MAFRFTNSSTVPKGANGTVGANRQEDKFVIRLPKGYREQIAEISQRNRRSMNSEITLVLEKFVAGKQPTIGPVDETEAKLIYRFQELTAHQQDAFLQLID